MSSGDFTYVQMGLAVFMALCVGFGAGWVLASQPPESVVEVCEEESDAVLRCRLHNDYACLVERVADDLCR